MTASTVSVTIWLRLSLSYMIVSLLMGKLLFGCQLFSFGWVILSERSELTHSFPIPHILALSIFMQIAEVLASTGFNGFYKINNISERYLICEVCFNCCEDAIHKANQVILC